MLAHASRTSACRRTRKFKEVKFQGACNNGYLITFKYFARYGFACVYSITEMMGGSQGNVDEPNAAAGFIAFQIRII